MAEPFVVVGGDAAGLSAASKCKREDPDRDVIVFERGRWTSYAHCGTPYYVKGEVEHLTDLLSLRPEDVEERGIDLRREHEVVSISPDDETVTVDGPDGRFEQPYGDLLVATGARAATGPIDGHELDGAFTLHGLDDAAAMRAYLAEPDTFDADDVDESYVDRDRVRHNAAGSTRARTTPGGFNRSVRRWTVSYRRPYPFRALLVRSTSPLVESSRVWIATRRPTRHPREEKIRPPRFERGTSRSTVDCSTRLS